MDTAGIQEVRKPGTIRIPRTSRQAPSGGSDNSHSRAAAETAGACLTAPTIWARPPRPHTDAVHSHSSTPPAPMRRTPVRVWGMADRLRGRGQDGPGDPSGLSPGSRRSR